jgi:protein SCO1
MNRLHVYSPFVARARNRGTTMAAVVALLFTAASAAAQPTMTGPDGTFSYDQRLSVPVPPDLAFRDEAGRDVTLSEYFGKRPIVLVLSQYRCPMLCTEVLNGLVQGLRGVPENASEGFDVLVVSFDARETPELAAAKKRSYSADYGRPGADKGWHFLTGSQPSIDMLTDTVGFRYAYSKPLDRFAHPTGVVVLTPSGRISRYFYGIEYPSADLAAAFTTAGAEQVGRPVPAYQQVLLLCYDYNPATGGYTLNVLNAVRLGGALTVVVIVAFMLTALLRERRARRFNKSAIFSGGAAEEKDE